MSVLSQQHYTHNQPLICAETNPKTEDIFLLFRVNATQSHSKQILSQYKTKQKHWSLTHLTPLTSESFAVFTIRQLLDGEENFAV